ncbi:hypothetical protein WMY93_029289 [Mugilogobius chulae]|uniref:Reticulon 4 receptor-like 1 n=1 Tax=Mugilogobius chulae TaxID=88201 RepID=A0AAW0MRT7_9GOBI
MLQLDRPDRLTAVRSAAQSNGPYPTHPGRTAPRLWAGVPAGSLWARLLLVLPPTLYLLHYPSTVSCQAHNFLTVPEGIPPESERIFLQNNKIHRLLSGHFSTNTVTLWIYSNNITYIEPSTFHGFTLLEELDLGDNKHLRSLAEDTFHGLSRLNALHLYRCGLSSLPSNIFQGLRNLQYLYLQDNHLKFLPDDTFMDLHNLSHLFLHGNHLWSLNQNTFRGLRALDRLLLHQNQIEWVDRLAFHDLKRLTTLYLFNNSLIQLSGQCLDMLPGLEYLRLNDNPGHVTARLCRYGNG